MSRRRLQPIGFTLIELLVVMVILAVAMGVAIPKLDLAFSERAQLERAAKRLKRVSAYARDLAICLRKDHILTLDLEGPGYRVSVRDPNGHYQEVKEGLMLAGRWPEGTTLEPIAWIRDDGREVTSVDLTLYATGECDPGEFILRSDRSDVLVQLSWLEEYNDAGPCEWEWIEKSGYNSF
ncbi:Tfp pilus assembly protein FimT/FimU [Planctomycetota bacterium]